MLYIFDKDDNFKNIITEDTGLIDTWFKDYQNHLIDEPFVFHVDSESELLPLIVAENQVAFKHTFNALQQDVETFKLMRIKEVDELYDTDGYVVEVTCEPAWLELYDHFIEDRRIVDGTANTAITRALDGSRWVGIVVGDGFGNGTVNFYWIDAVEALFKIAEEWGGTLQDYITLDENNEIATRVMYLLPRLGRDNGLLIQPDYNAETIERRTLSYPVTAIWGQGASLEIEDDEGQHTGGYTRYITFEDVEWKKSKGDPVDKPKGQKWVGDQQALAKYGYLKDDGTRMHRFGHFSNQDYETPEELLLATWQALQEQKEPEVYHEAVIDKVDKDVFLGDTATILDRHYGKPIEVQAQLTGIEYDILEPNENVKVVVGNYKDMSRDPLEEEIDEIKQNQKKPVIVGSGNFPNKKPMKPTNVEAVGGWETIQVTWDYTDEIYVSHYEVYASQNKDFVPDSQFLVYNGKVSAFGHEVKTDEVWYYRVCAVNYHGVKSEFSDEATASTIRIPLDATNFESIVTDTKNRADEAFDNANLATQNAMDAISKAQISFDKAIESLDQSGLALEQADESFQKALENATRVDNIALKIVGSNLISHDPSNWEQGGIDYRDGSEINNNNYNIRLKDYMELQPNQIYTLTNYTSHGITTIYFYDKDKNFISGFENRVGYGHNTFTTKDNAHFARGVVNSIDGTNLTPDMIGERIKVKLEIGDTSSDWTMHDPDYTNIVATQKGIQTEVGNIKGDVTTVTQIAEGLDTRIKNNEGDITNLQVTAQGLSGRLESVNTRLDELDGDDRNLITHLPANWEQGYISTGGSLINRSTSIRTSVYLGIKANEEYTLTASKGGQYFIRFYTSSEVFISGNNFNALEGEHVTFTTPSDASFYKIYVNSNIGDITPSQIGTDLKVKLQLGNKSSAWTPNFNDTGELVNSVQEFVHDFNVTAQGLASRISDNEGNINQLVSTVDGTQQTISNMQGDISTITNLANVHSLILESMDHNVNTLTQTVDATVSRLENMSGNMITHNVEMWEQGYIATNGTLIIRATSIRTADYLPIEGNKEYTLTSYEGGTFYVRFYNSSKDFIEGTNYNASVGNSRTFNTPSNARFYKIYVNSDIGDIDPVDIGTKLKVQLERGAYSNDWKDHAGDTYSQYSQLQDAINLRVKKGDVMSQINIEADRVLIDTTGRLVINAQSTLISNAVIKDAHIDSLNGRKIVSKSIVSDKLDVTSLSAITSDLGTVRSGRLLSQNNNIDFNLNNGTFDVFNQGSIRFNNSAGGVRRIQNGRSAILSFPVSAGSTTPMVAVGVVAQTGTINVNDSSFRGIRIHGDNVSHNNDLIGDVWSIRRRVDGTNGNILIDLSSTRKSISPQYASNYNYDLGTGSNYFDRAYVQNIRINEGHLTVNNNHDTGQGWRHYVGYDGTSYLSLVGLNAGPGWTNPRYYSLGTDNSRFSQLYLLNQPNVSSDERLKKDISDNDLGLSFINDIDTKLFRMNFDQPENYLKTGVIAQQVIKTLERHNVNVDDFSMVTKGEDGMYGVQYEQFIAPLIKSVQELDNKVNLTREELVLKIAELEQRINELESVP